MTITAATQEALARFTRKLVDDHDEWDTLHTFATLYPDDGGIRVGTWASIDPGMHPESYPGIMFGIVSEEVAKSIANGGGLPCAFALQIEAYAVIDPDEQATPDERAQLDADRRNRNLHTRADAQEICDAWCVDVDGNVWQAVKWRERPGVVEEKHWPVGHPERPTGTFMRALVSLATGMRELGAMMAAAKN